MKPQRLTTAKSNEDNVKTLSRPDYSGFDQIDGSHRFKEVVPNSHVEYQVRTRQGGSVFFFNFALAKEMGLIARDHPETLSPELQAKILETFALVIINEYDILHKKEFKKGDIRPNRYMATRYLQLQHPSKQGKTSGDGRGIWNGEYSKRGTTWDVSSSGTGATCLSPACAQTKKFVKTGDRQVGYGNGYNTLDEGLSAALMSDIFHKNGIPTERTLAIISFEAGTSINVRASKNLLRPAHFFHQLKQDNYEGLKTSIDFFIDRQVGNKDWPEAAGSRQKKKRYRMMAEQMALTFSRTAAQFESDYIFCWIDWDGDNILANGGIIDYGSIRQFGLYHWEYRYDDVDRMSTNIPEQRIKARYVVQCFAQIRNFLITGKKKNLRHFKNDPAVRLFDQNFEKVLNELLLKKMGLSEKQRTFLMENHSSRIEKLRKHHSYFEKTKSKRGIYKIEDGITCDAVFSMRDLMRELPKRLLSHPTRLDSKTFLSIFKSSYAKKRDLKINHYRKKEIKEFQRSYIKIMKLLAGKFHEGIIAKTLLEVSMRSSVVNRYDRITGDAIIHVTQNLIRNQRKLSFQQKHKIIETLVQYQVEQVEPEVKPESKIGKIVLRNIKAIQTHREGF